jgi:hypothetical protein
LSANWSQRGRTEAIRIAEITATGLASACATRLGALGGRRSARRTASSIGSDVSITLQQRSVSDRPRRSPGETVHHRW